MKAVKNGLVFPSLPLFLLTSACIGCNLHWLTGQVESFYIFLSYDISNYCNFVCNKHHVGSVIFEWLQSQCTNTEDKLEYDASQHLLTSFLWKEDTQQVLSANCLNAVKN